MGSQQVIKLKLKSFDHRVLDQAVSDIILAVKKTGAEVKGPVALPTKRKVIVLNKSPHIDKEAREQFEIRYHYRLLFICIDPKLPTVSALMNLELASGVEVDIVVLE